MPSESSHQEAVSACEPFGPVEPQERVALLDALRGLAILGILLVNHDIGNLYTEALFPSAFDRFGHTVVYTLGSGKFWPLFALLFGVGFAVQLERADARRANIILIYLRRVFFMALIGFVLNLGVNVPALLALPIAGVPMLLIGFLLRRRGAKWVLIAAVGCLLLQSSMLMARDFARDRGLTGPPDIAGEEIAARVARLQADWQADAERDASWSMDRLGERVQRMPRFYAGVPSRLVQQLGLSVYGNLGFMLVGIFLWRIGVLRDTVRDRRLFLRLLAVGLPIGLGAAIYTSGASHAWAMTRFGLGEYPTAVTRFLLSPMATVSATFLDLTYIAATALLMRHAVPARMLGFLAPVGRTALTNYALQALLPALVFGHYTPGIPLWYLGIWPSIAVLAVVFLLQVLFSRAWLRSFRFGPLEWVLRSLTYWRLQPIRAGRAA